MNIKAIALSSVLAIGSIFGAVAPASAGTCWFPSYANSSNLVPSYCSTNSRINYNGHKVLDVVDHKGDSFTLVFWTDRVVEIIGLTPRPVQATWYFDNQGDYRVSLNGNEFGIRY